MPERADRPRIDLGLYPTRPAKEMVRLGALAETLGFGRVWLTDSPVLWRELWVTLTAIGAATRSIGLGSAVTSGVTRHPAVTASAALTLAELTDGRFTLGVGNGDSSVATIGERPQTLGGLRATVERLRSLLGAPSGPPDRADDTLSWAANTRVPIFIAASGPRMLELAGAIADGVIMMVGVQAAMVSAAIERVRAGARQAGHDPDGVELVVWTACAVSDRAPEEAIAAVKATVARTVIRRLPLPMAGEHLPVVERIRAGYDYAFHSNARAPHARLVPDDLVAEFAIAGNSARCAERLRSLGGLGLSAVVLAAPDAEFEPRSRMMERLAAVLP
jgi:5,10-methylenetetrahydromethanopterin reductase